MVEQGLAGTGGVGVEQIVQMLMQGVTPEELLGMGIPQAVIEQAMEMVAASQPANVGGLAGMQIPGGV